MSKLCPINGCKTNCTDNCVSCMAEEKRYVVEAFICTNLSGLMHHLETDELTEAKDFIWEHCQKGNSCELRDRATGERSFYYADSFNENTIDYDDLLMEQREQM